MTKNILGEKIDYLGLSVRTNNCLKRAGINTIRELCNKELSELIHVRNLGNKSLEAIIERLNENGLSVRGIHDKELFEKWFTTYSIPVIKIIYDKPEFWEYRLYIAVNLKHYNELSKLRKKADFEYWKVSSQSLNTTIEIKEYVEQKLSELEECIDPEFEQRLIISLGAPGEDGDAAAIIAAAQQFMDYYKNAILWKMQFKDLSVPIPFRRILEACGLLGDKMLEDFDKFIWKLKNADEMFDQLDRGEIIEEEMSVDLIASFTDVYPLIGIMRGMLDDLCLDEDEIEEIFEDYEDDEDYEDEPVDDEFDEDYEDVTIDDEYFEDELVDDEEYENGNIEKAIESLKQSLEDLNSIMQRIMDLHRVCPLCGRKLTNEDVVQLLPADHDLCFCPDCKTNVFAPKYSGESCEDSFADEE